MVTQREGGPQSLRKLIEGGGQVIGNTAGAALAIVAGPILGTGAGVAMGEALARVGVEIYDRLLGPRQAARMGGALAVAVARIGERIDAGDTPRDDGFFEAGPTGRAKADEVLEGTLMVAANAWEERKVAPLGRLYANLAFDRSISPGTASFVLRLVEGLTYDQLLLMTFIDQAEQPGPYERAVVGLSAVASEERGIPDAALYAQIDGLSSENLVGLRQKAGPPVPPAATMGASSWGPSMLVRASLTPMGRRVHDLMELNLLSRDDLDAILNGLTGEDAT